MTDKVAGGVDAFVEALREAEQDFVAATVAVDVLLRLCENFVQNAPVQLVVGELPRTFLYKKTVHLTQRLGLD